MTSVGVFSLKGAPGVTTLSCLLAATWPVPGPLVVVEADPAGGDLAGRFGLSSTLGWSSLSAATRRSGRSAPLGPHLQHLPGGLPVLVSGGTADNGNPESEVVDIVERASADGLVVVDLGRRLVDSGPQDDWFRRCEVSVLVTGGATAAALHVRAHAARLVEVTSGRLGVLVVGSGASTSDEVAAFTGIRALGDVPFDPRSAAVASGASGAGRRLERSALLAAVRRVAIGLADRTAETATRDTVPDDHGSPDGADAVAEPVPDPVSSGTNGRTGVVAR